LPIPFIKPPMPLLSIMFSRLLFYR